MVLGRVWRFMKRHKGKIIFVGTVAAGLYASAKYLKDKLEEYHQLKMTQAFEEARKKAHYDANQRTCNSTVLSLMPTLRETIMRELDCEKLKEQLQQKPSNKVHIWSELKILAFTRAIVSVYSTCVLVLTLKVQLNIIGGYMYSRTTAENPLSEDDRKILDKYLGRMKYFLEHGVHRLSDAVRHSVEKELLNCSLKQQITRHSLESLMNKIRAAVENSKNCELSPFIDYITDTDRPVDRQQDADSRQVGGEWYREILYDTDDIVRSEDFHTILKECFSHGFRYLITHLSNNFTSEMPATLTHLSTNTEGQLPLVKLIPPLSGSIHVICTDTAEKYLQAVFNLSCINEFGEEIYMAFCQPPVPS